MAKSRTSPTNQARLNAIAATWPASPSGNPENRAAARNYQQLLDWQQKNAEANAAYLAAMEPGYSPPAYSPGPPLRKDGN